MPPATEVTVAMVAYHQAFERSLNTIGMSITSGGMGKNELSMKETTPRAHGARGLPAMPIIQSYKRRIMWGAYSAAGRREVSGCFAGRCVKLMARRRTISLR